MVHGTKHIVGSVNLGDTAIIVDTVDPSTIATPADDTATESSSIRRAVFRTNTTHEKGVPHFIVFRNRPKQSDI